jgi:hypothetical protein
MLQLFGLFAGPVACGRSEAEQERLPTPGAFSRFPAADLPTGTDSAPEVAENPWLSGFGGASVPEFAPEGEIPLEGVGANHSQAIPVDSAGDLLPPEETSGERGSGGSDSTSVVEVGEPELLLERRLERYLEGEGSDKLLGITGQAGVSPVACRIEIYSNGGTSPWRTIPLPDEFPPNGTLTLCSIPESHPECTVTMSGSLYNGNDALVLWCDEVVMDAFGRVGEDPGTAWTSADETLRSEGQDLVRCAGGNRSDPFSPFELGEEWIRNENGESPEEARQRCSLFEAPGEGGAAAFTL